MSYRKISHKTSFNNKITFSECHVFFIYIYFPKNINPEGLNVVLGYADGTTDIFQQVRFDEEDNYTEYKAIDNINNISSKKVQYITLRGVKKFNVSDKTYFIDFFKYL